MTKDVGAAEAAALLAEAPHVVVAGHMHPDADAIGSVAALAGVLRRRGTRVDASFGGPARIPEALRTIPGTDAVVGAGELLARGTVPDLFVSVDCANIERLGPLAELALAAPRFLVLDHHATNTRFGTHNLVDLEAESTTALLVRLFDAWGVGFDRDEAHALYAGLVTDTGSFRWVRGGTHALAERLLGHGLDAAGIASDLMDSHPFAWLPLLGEVMADAVLDAHACPGGIVRVCIPHDLVRSVRAEDVESVIDIVRTCVDADVAAVLKEQAPGVWAVSLRSRGANDVSAAALRCGGGGHPRAAGYTRRGSADEVVTGLLGALAGAGD